MRVFRPLTDFKAIELTNFFVADFFFTSETGSEYIWCFYSTDICLDSNINFDSSYSSLSMSTSDISNYGFSAFMSTSVCFYLSSFHSVRYLWKISFWSDSFGAHLELNDISEALCSMSRSPDGVVRGCRLLSVVLSMLLWSSVSRISLFFGFCLKIESSMTNWFKFICEISGRLGRLLSGYIMQKLASSSASSADSIASLSASGRSKLMKSSIVSLGKKPMGSHYVSTP